jgi:hypothetical protein
MNQDRRASGRLPTNLAVRSSGTVGCRTEDISVDGFVNTLGIAELGEAITLEFGLPSGEWLPVNGEVTSYLPGMGLGLGFKFTKVEEEIALRRLLTSLTIALLSSESLRSPGPDLHA